MNEPFKDVCIVCNSRAEEGPLQSVQSAMPGAKRSTADVRHFTPGRGLTSSIDHHTMAFSNYAPRLVVVLGDRYETLGAALAAKLLRIPVAHIQGGETTLGAIDNAFRDCITHLAELHFVAHPMFITKLLSLGVHRSLIHNVGASGLDNVPPNSANRDSKIILVTYHPETMAVDYGAKHCSEMLSALDAYQDYEIIFTGVNSDPGHDIISALIESFCAKHHGASVETGIDHDGYVKLMQKAAVVIGNSSAGVIEAPWVGVPSINLGDRQKGRPMSPSVWQALNIEGAMKWNGEYRPAYKGGAAPKIAEEISRWLSK